MGLIGILITLIIIAIVVYAVYLVLGMLPIPEPIKTLVWLAVAIIFLLWILSATGIYHGFG